MHPLNKLEIKYEFWGYVLKVDGGYYSHRC